jgi:predicted molibdopterin-dependent oxidoreductase YjgC
MFRRLTEARRPVLTVLIDGKPVEAQQGDSVAAAMLAAGRMVSRKSPVGGAVRGPYCLMGVCFECLVAVDGVPNRQACMVAVHDGMRIETGQGKREFPR